MIENIKIGTKVRFVTESLDKMSNPELIDLTKNYSVVCISPLKIEDDYANVQRISRKDYEYLVIVSL